MRQRDGISTLPCSTEISPAMTPNSVVLPVPLRPTKPTRAPVGMRAEALFRSVRPAIRTVRSSMMSMPRLLADSAPRSNPSLESLTRADEHTHGCQLLTQSGHGCLQMDPSSTIARVERLEATTGQNVKMEYRWAAGHDERLPAMAVELVNRQGGGCGGWSNFCSSRLPVNRAAHR